MIFSVYEKMLSLLSKISETVRSCMCLRVNGEGVTMLRNRADFHVTFSLLVMKLFLLQWHMSLSAFCYCYATRIAFRIAFGWAGTGKLQNSARLKFYAEMLLQFNRWMLSDIEYAIIQEDCLQQAVLEVLPFVRGFFHILNPNILKSL